MYPLCHLFKSEKPAILWPNGEAMKSDEEIGAEAARLAHAKVLQEAKRAKLTIRKVLMRINQGLDAHETKCKFDGGQYGEQKWVYSKKLVNWETRSKSIDQAILVLNMKPQPDEFEDTLPATPVKVVIEVIDARKGAGEQAAGTIPCDAE